MLKDGINETSHEVLSFLMIGQSNMAGRGDFGEVEEIDNDNCLMLRMGRWQKMSEPINPDRAVLNPRFHSGVGLAASFADGASRALCAKIGLIPCADGGTKIDLWMPGEILFDHAVMMAELAMRTSRLSGILWHQGESDCTNDEDMLSHKEKFKTMINAMRKRLGEDIPLVIGELSENIGVWNVGERPAIMNSRYRELTKELKNSITVSAKGLTLKPDKLHFNSHSLRTFGNRYLDAYLELSQKIKDEVRS